MYEFFFDDKVTSAMGCAFDLGCEKLGVDRGSVAGARMASRIIEAAKQGETDQTRFYRQALMAGQCQAVVLSGQGSP